MSDKPKLLSTVNPWNQVSQGYATVAMPYFQEYAAHALSLIEINPTSHVLDVACGPGTLSLLAAKKVSSVQAIDFSPAMLAFLEEKLTKDGITNVEWACEDGQALSLANNRFDVAFSLFGLMFFPDRIKGLAEIFRTLKAGGGLVISSWAPVRSSSGMQAIFGALQAIKPDIPDPQEDLESLENPEFFKKELESSGFIGVKITPLTKQMTYPNVGDYWSEMVKANAILVMIKNSVSETEWEEKSKVALEFLQKEYGDTEVTFETTAWFGQGTKP